SAPPPQERPQGSAEVAVAAAIAALILAPQPATVPVMAAELLPVLPAWLLALPELAADVAEGAAALALASPPSLKPGAGELELRASLENVLVRGFYVVAAARRLSEAVRGTSDAPVRERLSKAVRTERGHLSAHIKARAKNLEGARKTDRARELYGDVLSWNHGETRTPADPRLDHLSADGKNFDVRRGPPVSTGAWPGVLPL
ncbi:MAG: hypothetical protein M3P49_02875, partial [Actinomycetota bacterium]|nr:hypothetical protein [Actinomycetota bacterium]